MSGGLDLKSWVAKRSRTIWLIGSIRPIRAIRPRCMYGGEP